MRFGGATEDDEAQRATQALYDGVDAMKDFVAGWRERHPGEDPTGLWWWSHLESAQNLLESIESREGSRGHPIQGRMYSVKGASATENARDVAESFGWRQGWEGDAIGIYTSGGQMVAETIEELAHALQACGAIPRPGESRWGIDWGTFDPPPGSRSSKETHTLQVIHQAIN